MPGSTDAATYATRVVARKPGNHARELVENGNSDARSRSAAGVQNCTSNLTLGAGFARMSVKP